MVGRSVILVVLAATISAAGALAADPPAPPEKQRLICRGGGGRSLGSHIRTPRRCRTAEQWQEEDEAKGRAPISLQITQGQNDGRQGAAPR
jgi:hypothetical protein